MIKIIDKFLNVEDLNILSFQINSDSFPWYYKNYRTEPGDGNTQFIHTFYDNFNPVSSFFPYLTPFIIKLKMSLIKQIKIKMTLKTNKIVTYKFNTDFNNKNIKTGIFYLDTNNGKTIFKNGKKIDSIKNRLIVFPSNLEYAETSNTDTQNKIVINFNWF
jgi:hypothetical protein